MTSQIVPGANQQFHQTPLFWGGQKSPPQCCLQADFPTGNLNLFYGVGRLETANRVKLKTLGIFSGCILQPRKVEFRHVLKLFFSNCRPLGWNSTQVIVTPKIGGFFGRPKKKTKGDKKKASTHDSSSHFLRAKQRVKRFESGETTMTPCYACDRHDQGVVPGLLAPPKGSEQNIHPSVANGPTDQHVMSHLNEKVLK